MLWLGTLAGLLGSTLYAQDIAGDWQGTLKAGSQQLRLVVQIARGDSGGWKATWIRFWIGCAPSRTRLFGGTGG